MTSGRGGGRVPNYTPQDQMTVDYTGGGGYMYAGGGGVTQVPVAAAAAAAATLIRTSLHQVLPTQQRKIVISQVSLSLSTSLLALLTDKQADYQHL